MSKSSLDRRTFLRGLLGGAAVSIALPPLDIFMNGNGTAYAAGSGLPVRFGLFMWGNGILPDRWRPTGAEFDWELSEQLAPLAGVKEHVSVVTGMEVRVPNIEPHHATAAGILSGSPLILEGDHRTFSAASIDQVIANQIGGDSRFKSIEFGVDVDKGSSYNGPDNINPPETSPAALFERIFGGSFRLPGEDAEPDPRIGLRLSVLDAVSGDIARLNKRLGATDRERLDQHLTGIRELEQRIDRLANLKVGEACAVPGEPLPAYPDIDGRPQMAERNRALTDVMVMAIACDQTRVFSNFFSNPVGNTLYRDAPAGHHQLTHDEPGTQPEVHKIVLQIVEEYAYVVDAFSKIEEGDGTLLDNLVLFGTSDVSFGRTHSPKDFPILIAGAGGGRLKKGYYYHSDTEENASDVLLTMANTVITGNGGIPLSEFGNDDGLTQSSLGALEI